MEPKRFDRGDTVLVHRASAQRAAERATVVDVRRGGRLRVEFPDGHRSTWTLDEVVPAPQA